MRTLRGKCSLIWNALKLNYCCLTLFCKSWVSNSWLEWHCRSFDFSWFWKQLRHTEVKVANRLGMMMIFETAKMPSKHTLHLPCLFNDEVTCLCLRIVRWKRRRSLWAERIPKTTACHIRSNRILHYFYCRVCCAATWMMSQTRVFHCRLLAAYCLGFIETSHFTSVSIAFPSKLSISSHYIDWRTCVVYSRKWEVCTRLQALNRCSVLEKEIHCLSRNVLLQLSEKNISISLVRRSPVLRDYKFDKHGKRFCSFEGF